MENLATIEKQKLTDGSVAYNVLVNVGEATIRFGCADSAHALVLMRELNECVWAELAKPE